MPASPHITRLRAKIGHDLLLLPSVAVIPIDGNGRILLVSQTDFGTFGTIGGAIDEDETPADAGKRETREETGLEVELTHILGATGGPEFHLTYPNGDQVAYVSVVYAATIIGDLTVRPDNDEVDGARWFTREELCSPQVNDFALNTLRSIGWI